MSGPTKVTRTLEQVRDLEISWVGRKGIPNPWWPVSYGNDCMAAQAFALGLRSRASLAGRGISISQFRAWVPWDEPGVDELRSGDLVLQNWTGEIDHIEFCYSINHAAGTIVTLSANTGPSPGVSKPRGFWKKTRPIDDHIVGGVRPPYKAVTTATSSKRKTQVKTVARYLNRTLDGPDTAAQSDGIPGPVYWLLVQRWGRAHGLYGAGYSIDGVVGPRTRVVEKAVIKAARA